MRSPHSSRNARTTPCLAADRCLLSPTLEEQAQSLVSAMKYWDTLVNDLDEQVFFRREQMEELSRLYRHARRAWVELRQAQGKPANADFPQWVDDFYTYP